MKQRLYAEPLAFTLALLAGIGVVVMALRFPHLAEAHSGPGSFPLFLGALLVLLAGCGLGFSLKKQAAQISVTEDPGRLRLPLLGGLTALYLLFMPLIGFISGTTLLCAAALRVLGYRNAVRALAAGFIAAFALYAVFGILMNVALPKGWIG
ncbi:MAG: tripartite tricarboxylate transporter TctB family protein [Kiritimatiellia bacterium]